MFVGELILIGVAIGIGIPLWGIIDAAQRPPESFRRIGSDKTRWILILVLLTVFLNLGGVIASIVYLTSVRPRLRATGKTPLDIGNRTPGLPDGQAPNTLASDEDRERVTGQLQRHFEAGRLNLEVLHERLEATLKAQTMGDLFYVTRDLPPN